MVINKYNLEVSTHSTDGPQKGWGTDTVLIDRNGSTATNNAYCVTVSPLGSENFDPICLSMEDAKRLRNWLGDSEGTMTVTGDMIRVEKKTSKAVEVWTGRKVTNKFPQIQQWENTLKADPRFEISIDAGYLLKIAQAITDFHGQAVRIRFFANATDPVKFEAFNKATGQSLQALLMPRTPGKDQFEAEPVPPPPPPPEPAITVPMTQGAGKSTFDESDPVSQAIALAQSLGL